MRRAPKLGEHTAEITARAAAIGAGAGGMTDARSWHHRDRCAIAGIGTTDFTRDSGRSDLTLAIQASLAALDDAGIAAADIDGIVRCDLDLVRHNDLADTLGVRDLTYWGEVGPGGVAPCAMVGQAVGAILSGQATTVAGVPLAERPIGRALRAGRAPGRATTVGGDGTYDEFFLPTACSRPARSSPSMAQRHMLEYGTTEKELGPIALDLPGTGPTPTRRPRCTIAPAHHGRLPGRADDLRPAAAVRLLPGDRRRRPRWS